jgi:hypothetical protein
MEETRQRARHRLELRCVLQDQLHEPQPRHAAPRRPPLQSARGTWRRASSMHMAQCMAQAHMLHLQPQGVSHD